LAVRGSVGTRLWSPASVGRIVALGGPRVRGDSPLESRFGRADRGLRRSAGPWGLASGVPLRSGGCALTGAPRVGIRPWGPAGGRVARMW
jgi:hypothetical protein